MVSVYRSGGSKPISIPAGTSGLAGGVQKDLKTKEKNILIIK